MIYFKIILNKPFIAYFYKGNIYFDKNLHDKLSKVWISDTSTKRWRGHGQWFQNNNISALSIEYEWWLSEM